MKNAKKQILVSVLAPEIYQAVSNHLTMEVKDATYGDINNSLSCLYGKPILVWSEIRKFKMATMAQDENVQKFFQRLKELAKTCEFTEVENQVRDQLMTGLTSKIFEKVCDKPRNITLQEAYQACVAAEFKMLSLNEVNATAFRVESKPWGHQNNKQEDVRKRLGPPPAPRSSKPKWDRKGCFRCLSTLHRGQSCPYDEFVCNNCFKKGHLRRACNKKDSRKHSVKQVDEESDASEAETVSGNSCAPSEQTSHHGTVNRMNESKRDRVSTNEPFFISVKIKRKIIKPEIDSGS